jgi:monoamine oxidase
MNSGSAIKFFLYYDTAWWRAANLSGEIVSCRDDDWSKICVCVCVAYELQTTQYINTHDSVHLTYDACTSSLKATALVGFVSGAAAQQLLAKTSDASDAAEARGRVLDERLRLMLPDDVAPPPPLLAYRECDWHAEAFTDGCVNSTRPGGWLTRLRGVDDDSLPIVRRHMLSASPISGVVGCRETVWLD